MLYIVVKGASRGSSATLKLASDSLLSILLLRGGGVKGKQIERAESPQIVPFLLSSPSPHC